MSDMPEETVLGARSIYGAKTGRGLVELTAGPTHLTIPPSKAREFAGFLLEAAASAEGDEVLMRVLDRAGMSPQRATQVLIAMRRERAIIERRARDAARRAVAYDQVDPDLRE